MTQTSGGLTRDKNGSSTRILNLGLLDRKQIGFLRKGYSNSYGLFVEHLVLGEDYLGVVSLALYQSDV